MKARAKQRRFFNKGVKPNICVLENVHFDGNELKDYMDFVGRDLFTAPLQTTLRQFEEADNFGSLIRPDVTDVDGMLRILESKNVSGQLFISMTHQKVLQALRQADYLSPKYHVVIANPPYMGMGRLRNLLGFHQPAAAESRLPPANPKGHLPEAPRPLAGDDAGDAAAGGREQPHLHRRLRPAGRADARGAAQRNHPDLQPALPLRRRQERGRAGGAAAGRHHARAGPPMPWAACSAATAWTSRG
jgi:hypothetical protein